MSDETLYKAETNRQVTIQESGWPTVLIGTGVTLLVLNLLNISIMSLAWPLWIVLPGVALAYPAYHLRRHSRLNYLAIPGAFFLALGALLGVMNLFNHFEAWAYAWTLLPAAMVAGTMYAKRYRPDSAIHTSGPPVYPWILDYMWCAGSHFRAVNLSNPGPLVACAVGSGWLLHA